MPDDPKPPMSAEEMASYLYELAWVASKGAEDAAISELAAWAAEFRADQRRVMAREYARLWDLADEAISQLSGSYYPQDRSDAKDLRANLNAILNPPTTWATDAD